MIPVPLYYQLCSCTIDCGISHSSDLINALKELLLVEIQYNKPMLKVRPAERQMNILPRLG